MNLRQVLAATTASPHRLPAAAPFAVEPVQAAAPERDTAQAGRWLSFLTGHGIHPKLNLSSPGDTDEREADAVAERIMRMPDPGVSVSRTPAKLSRKCGQCADEDETNLKLKRDRPSAPGGEDAPAGIESALDRPGEPLSPRERAFFEPRFGRDLSSVRIHDHSAADNAARSIHARAFTIGKDIGFARGEFRPGSSTGRRLLAHELTHTLQGERNLPGRLAGRQGRAGDRSSPTETKVSRQVVAPPVPGAPFNDPVAWSSDVEAAKAMRAYQALSPVERRKAVADSYEHDLISVLSALSAIDKTKTFLDSLREIARFVEEIETQKSAGKTDDQIAGEQAKFIIQEAKAAADAKAAATAAAAKKPVVPPTPAEIEAERKSNVAANSSVTPPVVGWWAGLSPAQKTSWTNRGNAAIASIVALAKAKNPELGITAANFNLDFEKVEKRGSNVIAAGSPALVGKTFVETAELNPAYVMDIVVHEVFGHPEYGTYGDEYHLKLYDQAAAKVPGYIKPAAGTPERTQELDAYAYQETEIYAVLRSMPFRTAPSAVDAGKVPNLDTQALVNAHLASMKKQWSPTLIVAVVRGLRKRLMIDPRIGAPAIAVFVKAVSATFDPATFAAIFK